MSLSRTNRRLIPGRQLSGTGLSVDQKIRFLLYEEMFNTGAMYRVRSQVHQPHVDHLNDLPVVVKREVVLRGNGDSLFLRMFR